MPTADGRDGATATVVVTAWRHGDDVVGRVTPVPRPGAPSTPGRACASLDDICDAVRDLVGPVVGSGA